MLVSYDCNLEKGPAGADALANLPELPQSWFRTALLHHQFHALGLLPVGLLADRVASRWIVTAGTLLFSGNLYLCSLAGIDVFRIAVPWGGGQSVPRRRFRGNALEEDDQIPHLAVCQ